MLASSDLISYSRALTKAETSSSPFWLRALSDVCERTDRAVKTLTRFEFRALVFVDVEGSSGRFRLG